MSKTQKTQIREAINKVKICGWLKEKELEVVEKEQLIRGSLTIMTSPTSEIQISVYAKKLTANKQENSAYKGLLKIMNEYVSMAELFKENIEMTSEQAQEQCTKVRVNRGTLRKYERYVNGNFYSTPTISANFFTRVDDPALFEPCAEFELECYVESIKKETKDSEETGKILLNTIVPVYGGQVIPMELVADGEVGEYITDNYPLKSTVNIWGDIVNTVERTVTKKSGFGASKEEVNVNYTRELMITGGVEEPYDEDDKNVYTTDEIKAAWKIRETETLPELLRKSENKSSETQTKGTSGFNGTPKQESDAVAGFKF